MKKLDQNGSHLIVILLAIVVIAVIGFVGWRVFGNKKQADHKDTGVTQPAPASEESEKSISWMWSGSQWQASGTPPKCKEPLTFAKSPTDVSKATAILYPGQTRGGNYKPHGGFRFGGNNTDVIVVAPIDAKLVEGSRYIEQGETQYMLRFTNDCGLSYRFDHLLTLSPTLQAEVNKLPEPKVDDSRTTNFDKPISVKTGDTVATATGFKNTKNVSFDFGVYDLRQRNKAAQDSAYVSLHQSEASQAAYALCWFDMLPSSDSAIVKSLPAADQQNGKKSDYCK